MNPETSWQFYLDSNTAWEAIFEAARGARHSIDIEEFILHNDSVGGRLLDILKEKAASGVQVRLLIDWIGSHHTYLPWVGSGLLNSGMQITFFNPPLPWNSRHRTFSYRRDHNKNIVIDSRIGFTGGICISRRMDGWRDTTVRIEGPVVRQMQDAFEYMWEHTTRRDIRRRTTYTPPAASGPFRFVLNIPFKKRRYLYQLFLRRIAQAREEILITNPYVAPTDRLFRLLVRKAREGVRVMIITPEAPDSLVVKYAAQSYIEHALAAGIRVFYQQPPLNHAKTMTIDGTWGTVGSMNFDYISLVRNFEGNIVTEDRAFVGELREHFEADRARSRELALPDWHRRPWHERFLAWLISPARRWL